MSIALPHWGNELTKTMQDHYVRLLDAEYYSEARKLWGKDGVTFYTGAGISFYQVGEYDYYTSASSASADASSSLCQQAFVMATNYGCRIFALLLLQRGLKIESLLQKLFAHPSIHHVKMGVFLLKYLLPDINYAGESEDKNSKQSNTESEGESATILKTILAVKGDQAFLAEGRKVLLAHLLTKPAWLEKLNYAELTYSDLEVLLLKQDFHAVTVETYKRSTYQCVEMFVKLNHLERAKSILVRRRNEIGLFSDDECKEILFQMIYRFKLGQQYNIVRDILDIVAPRQKIVVDLMQKYKTYAEQYPIANAQTEDRNISLFLDCYSFYRWDYSSLPTTEWKDAMRNRLVTSRVLFNFLHPRCYSDLDRSLYPYAPPPTNSNGKTLNRVIKQRYVDSLEWQPFCCPLFQLPTDVSSNCSSSSSSSSSNTTSAVKHRHFCGQDQVGFERLVSITFAFAFLSPSSISEDKLLVTRQHGSAHHLPILTDYCRSVLLLLRTLPKINDSVPMIASYV